jgi:myo-inositol-1(or 4)-monophosphatase
LPAIDTRGENAELAAHLGEAVREGGELALKTFRGTLRSWTKDKDSPVSEADIAVDALLRERLARPGTGWLSEESKDDRTRLAARRIYIVDPIDGTRSYIAGRPDWSIVAAVVEDGRPIAAAVFAPVDDELFLAAAGDGATCNGAPIAVTAGHELKNARVAGPKRFLERLSEIEPAIIQVPKIHSLALRLTRVAQGAIDAALASVNAHDWDLAAADLLVHEAGGAMTTLAGDKLVYNLHETVHGAVLAAGRARHATMLDLVRERRKDFA